MIVILSLWRLLSAIPNLVPIQVKFYLFSSKTSLPFSTYDFLTNSNTSDFQKINPVYCLKTNEWLTQLNLLSVYPDQLYKPTCFLCQSKLIVQIPVLFNNVQLKCVDYLLTVLTNKLALLFKSTLQLTQLMEPDVCSFYSTNTKICCFVFNLQHACLPVLCFSNKNDFSPKQVKIYRKGRSAPKTTNTPEKL